MKEQVSSSEPTFGHPQSPGQRTRFWWDLDDTRRQLRELRERDPE
jgi:hypothetical protein